ncbi:MAG: hypothetical protein FDZ75_04475, partial [Actinobacteria bacterium]
IKMHQETISSESNSPLQLIREKELEISGRLLAAKRQADEIISDARKRASEIVANAEAQGGTGAKASADSIISKAQGEADQLRQAANVEAAEVAERVEKNTGAAARLVVDAVTSA